MLRHRRHERRYWHWQRDGEGIAPAQFTVAIVNFLIKTRWLDEREASDRRRWDAPSRVRLLKINPEIANQTTVVAT